MTFLSTGSINWWFFIADTAATTTSSNPDPFTIYLLLLLLLILLLVVCCVRLSLSRSDWLVNSWGHARLQERVCKILLPCYSHPSVFVLQLNLCVIVRVRESACVNRESDKNIEGRILSLSLYCWRWCEMEAGVVGL